MNDAQAIGDAQAIRDALRDLPNPVTPACFAPDVDRWYSRAERALLEEVARASDRIALQVRAERWDAAREAAAGIRLTPAIALLGEQDCGIRYDGISDGYEPEPFLGVLRAVAERRSGLTEASIARLRRLAGPLHLEVLASPT